MTNNQVAVFVVGASGTGKSTLAAALARELGWELLPSVTRATAAELGGYDAVEADPELYDRFQLAVCRRNGQQVWERGVGDQSFVADRSIDHLAYSALYSRVGGQAFRSEEAKSTAAVMRGELCRSVVLLLRPHYKVHQQAVIQGGRSTRYVEWDAVCRVDGAVKDGAGRVRSRLPRIYHAGVRRAAGPGAGAGSRGPVLSLAPLYVTISRGVNLIYPGYERWNAAAFCDSWRLGSRR